MKKLPLTKTSEKHIYINFAYDCGKLTINEFGMYVALLRKVNEKLGYAFPSYEDLMSHLNITSRNTLNKYIKALEEKGFIIKVKGTVNQNNRYYFVHPNDIDLTQIESKKKDSTKAESFKKDNIDVSKNALQSDVPKNELLSYQKMVQHDVSQNDTLKENIKENIKENNNGVAIAPPSNANAKKDKNQSNQNKVDNNIMMKEIYKTLLSQLNLKHDKKYANTVAKKLRENSEALEQIHKETMEFNYDRIINKYKDEYERLNKVLYTIINEANQQYKRQKEKESFYGELPDELQDYYDTFPEMINVK